MILKTKISLNLRGENFSPRRLFNLTGVSFADVVEKGETRITTGLNKGQIASYGKASLKTQSSEEAAETESNEALYKLLLLFHDKVYKYIEESGVDRIVLWIHYIFDIPGSGLEFNPDSLLLLGKMNIPIAINMTYCSNYPIDERHDLLKL